MTDDERSFLRSLPLGSESLGEEWGDTGKWPRALAGITVRLARGAVLRRLEGLEEGELEVSDATASTGKGRALRFGRPAPDGLRARLTVRDPRFWTTLATAGSVGAGEAYAAGWWEADDLVAVIRLVARNRSLNAGLEGGLAAGPRRLLGRLAHLSRSGRFASRTESRRNVIDHYDLGTELFSQFLDAGLTYSCAIFPSPGASLERAQQEKLDRVCRVLDLGPGDEVIEIGTGWGSFALHAAGEYGCRVTTTTLSDDQFAVATDRIRSAGLAERVTLLQADYRDLPGLVVERGRRFDKLVSIEMIEAVGEPWLDCYLGVVNDLLKPHGKALIQAILMVDRYYDAYRRSPDLIQRLIFPGTHLPSLADLLRRTARVTELTLAGLEDITDHYAETLARWRERFVARLERVRSLGFSAEFCRLWELYLCYCEGGFREGVIRDAQLLLEGPRAALDPGGRPGAGRGRA